MTAPLPLPAPLKRLARIVRDSPASNNVISAAIGALPRSGLKRRLIGRVPRIGNASARLPDGTVMRMRSALADSVTTSIFYNGWTGQEPEVLPIWRELVLHAKTILDVGAHVGHFSIVAGLTQPQAEVHCFEPLPRVVRLLRHNLSLNELAAQVHEVALNTSVGSVTFYAVPEGVPSSSSLSRDFMTREHGSELEEVTVSTSTLDTLLPNVSGPVLMKIDTETTEPDVLAGGQALLARCKPIIVVEVLVEHETGPALHRELARAGLGFTPYLMTHDGLVAKDEIRADPRFRNYLLVPTDGPMMTPEIRELLDARIAK